jgi:hypothetical protein
MTAKTTPDPTTVALVCTGCHHWQIDCHPRAVSQLGGRVAVFTAIAEAHIADHDCPGEGGRIKVFDQWVDRPKLSDGVQADAVLAAQELPAWWVWR